MAGVRAWEIVVDIWPREKAHILDDPEIEGIRVIGTAFDGRTRLAVTTVTARLTDAIDKVEAAFRAADEHAKPIIIRGSRRG